MTVLAVITTLALWFIGLLIDNSSNLGLTFVLPFIGMGAFIIEAIKSTKK